MQMFNTITFNIEGGGLGPLLFINISLWFLNQEFVCFFSLITWVSFFYLIFYHYNQGFIEK